MGRLGGVVVNFFLNRKGPGVWGVGGDLVVDAIIVWRGPFPTQAYRYTILTFMQ